MNLRRKWSSATAKAKTARNVNMKTTIPRITTSIERPFLRCGFLLITLVLGFFAFSLAPTAFGVNPPPDGGYPGGNTAEGTNALFSRTNGVWNTALGAQALYHDTAGNQNTATGVRALFSATVGNYNTANGVYALYGNINGWFNSAIGAYALANNISGNQNTATGYGALNHNTADDNTATGFGALFRNSNGLVNVADGYLALNNNTDGAGNTATGAQALLRNTTGIANTATGRSALSFSTGDLNTAIGYSAGSAITTAANVICIGANVAGADVSDSCYIGNIFNQTSFNGIPVLVNGDNKLGTTTSSKRFKRDIRLMGQTSEPLFLLKPVIFRYKEEIDPAGISQFGLIAEDVDKVSPDLVVRDKDGKPYSVRYEQVNAMLLNEFLKEHRRVEAQQGKIEEQDVTISQLKSTLTQQQKRFELNLAQQEQQIAALTADLQRLAADIELNKVESRAVAEK